MTSPSKTLSTVIGRFFEKPNSQKFYLRLEDGLEIEAKPTNDGMWKALKFGMPDLLQEVKVSPIVDFSNLIRFNIVFWNTASDKSKEEFYFVGVPDVRTIRDQKIVFLRVDKGNRFEHFYLAGLERFLCNDLLLVSCTREAKQLKVCSVKKIER